MKSDEAKRLLLDYRPGITEPSREITEALHLARQDRELKEWFERQQEFDTGIRTQLQAIEVPPDLKQKILGRRKIVPLWKKYLPACAAAAAVAVLITLSIFWIRPHGEDLALSGYQNRMVGFALREYRMDVLSEDRTVIRQFMAKRGAPSDYKLPASLDALQPMGGARLSWQGHPVSMLCYKLKEKEIAYVFVIPAQAIQANETGTMPQFASSKGLNTATWRDDAHIYFVAAPLNELQLQQLLQQTSASL